MSDMEGTPQQEPEEKSTTKGHKQPTVDEPEPSNTATPSTKDTSHPNSREHAASLKSKSPASDTSTRSTRRASDSADPTKMPVTTTSHSITANSSTTNTAAHTPNPPDAAGASPYGTRSRNRTGNARPNYAEDRENEMDFEYTSNRKGRSSSTTAPPSQTAEVEKTPSTHGRRSANNGSATKTATAPMGAAKEQIPGTSTFSVVTDTSSQPHSKKRKAPGSGATTVAAPTPTPSSISGRRATNPAPITSEARDTNMVSFEHCQRYLSHGHLIADDKTRFKLNDTVYLVCEPPGEPYYLARIMEFLHAGNNPSGPVESLRLNWIYRPRDIGRKATDTRLVFASMHSDTSPLLSLRGKCTVQHRSCINDLEAYRKQKDCFYYNQMYDRYIHRYYEVIPTSTIINVPEEVKRVLDERWRYVIVESGRAKELTSAIKTCKRCNGYCASNDSVDCAMCKQTYHMNCVQPPLLKKPARGFGWSCGPCSRKQERKLEARNTPLVGEKAIEQEEVFEEEEEHAANSNPTNGSTPGISDDHQEVRKATKEQIAQAKLWPYRYLGIHCKVEDALDYDDRIYPRASSRLGPRHQANVLAWHDHCVEYIKPAEIKRKYIKSGHKKDTKLTKETVAALEADKVAREKRPKWVLDEPAGFVHRGDDHPNDSSASTAKIVFRLPKVGESSSRGDDLADGQGVEDRETIIDKYMAKARKIAPSLGLEAYHTNFLDKAIELLYANNFNMDVALKQLQNIDLRKDLKEPKLSKEELRKFEEGVAKYGSSLADVSRHIGRGVKHGDIVRFYYGWKKSDKGKQIWGSYEGRKSKKQAKNSDTALLDVVADDIDDSAFDNEKAAKRKRGFECKFCSTRQSRFWRRAPLTQPGTTVAVESGNKTSKDKSQQFMVALCQRCAGLWRKYAIQWENIDDVAKKVSSTGGRAFKKKIDEELLIELVHANEASSVAMSQTAVAAAQTLGVDVPTSLTIQPEDGSRKKARLSTEKENSQQPIHSEPPKKRVIEKPVEPPLVPEQPKFKTLPCAVCNEMEPTGSEHFTCRHCRLTVHRNCYGIPEGRSANKWICDMCSNDSTNQYSTNYECVLCPVQYNEFDLFEPPRATHKKKSDREREKERLEKELVVEATVSYQKKKEELGRPIFPREPLKPTAGNKWVHVVCAVWTPWIRFKDAGTLEKAEGILSIPASKFKQVCKYCKTDVGVCVTCHKCPHTFHVTCAQQYGLSMGFDVTPVKSSRRDVVNTVTLGNETGTAEAVVYCKDHPPKNILHLPNEAVEESSLNALQIFVQSFKQSDSLLTGTVRKAAIINSSRTNTINNAVTANGHRGSISNGSGGTASRSLRASPAAVTVKSEEVDEDGDRIVYLDNTTPEPSVKQCYLCESNTSPKWYKKPSKRPENGALEAAALTEARSEAAPAYHCHKCDLSVRARKEASAAAKPKPVVSERLPSRELVPAESQVTQVAPSPNPIWQAPAPPPQHPGHWPTQAPPSNPPPPLVNGVSHTPPAHSIPLVQSPYAAPPPPTQPLSPYYSNGYERREPPPIQHQVNGAPSPYMARRPSGPREQLVYAHPPPPPPPPPHLSSPQFGHPIVNGAHSPPTGYRVNQGPSGPLRAAENPFFQPQRSPTQHYRGPHESPRSRNDPRPLTPGNSSGRSSAWERDRERERERERDRERERERTESQMANGASASPSLRNLLH